ncbi:MAG: hypothetical protein ACU0A5_10745 [Salipiger marinus]|uniref:hypothetical protein n=1 Tax=Salipiger marinus TaxID=555512 RepID=UPI004059B03C
MAPGIMTRRADVIRRANEIGAGLPDEQRVALGVMLILDARCPESFAVVRQAERLVAGHARLLLSDAMAAEECPHLNMAIAATTHGLPCDRHPGGTGAAGEPRPSARSSLRAAWARFRVAERRFSDSFWGDVLACACLCGIIVAAPFIIWGLQ